MEPNKKYPIATYVHLGPSLPEHLILSIKRHRGLFPDQKITLIVDHDIDVEGFHLIDVFKVDSKALEQDLFFEMSQYLDFDFRQNFWKYTFQRFFAINLYHSTVEMNSLLHIESDVIVMPDFPWKAFLNLKNAAWLQVNDLLDVAALVYLPNFQTTQFFVTQLKEYASRDPKINDMVALRKFAKEFPDRHHYLPSRTNSSNRREAPLVASEERNVLHFGGIFDPLMLGLWYFGQDPKNSFGFCKRYVDDESHFLSPIKSRLLLSGNSLQMGDSTNVFSLHIHSKKLSLFGDHWNESLAEGLNEASMQSNQISFDWGALLKSFEGRKIREIIWQLLGAIPIFQELRKITAVEKAKNMIKRLTNL
jgi:hypothetical protein